MRNLLLERNLNFVFKLVFNLEEPLKDPKQKYQYNCKMSLRYL